MATKTLRYTLEDFENITFGGFEYTIPDSVLETISKLAMHVGSPNYIKTPVFPKRDNPMKVAPSVGSENSIGSNFKDSTKKRRGNKAMEIVNDADWDALRSFQTTKIESKTGIEADFDSIRTLVNKLTDKNYNDLSLKIFDIIEKVVSENEESQLDIISSNIFDMASSNRYYSKIYAQLYSDLSNKYDFIKHTYIHNLKRFTELFDNIEYVDPNQNYDKFCEINQINEKRKSLASFYLNLMNFGIISKSEIMIITRNLLAKIYEFISLDNKKNEVDELTETIAILYKKDLYEDDDGDDYEQIQGYTINEIVEKIAKCKVKDYKSLTNKSHFKFMDLIDM
jgi:hypothetical protein